MFWAIIAMGEPILHGWSNIIDNYLINGLFKKTTTLMFFSSLTNILFLPLVFLLDPPSRIQFGQIPFFLILGCTGIAYLYPYYQALKQDDTSIIVSLFSLGKVFVPFLAFFLVGEVLSIQQYIGFFIIIICGALLSFDKKKLSFNKGFYWMILCTLILAIESVTYKYIFSEMSWGTGFTRSTLFSFMFALPVVFLPKVRLDIKLHIKKFMKNFHIFALEEFLTFAGEGARTFAISLTSVTLVSAISSFQSMFVLLYAIILGTLFPKIFKEDISKKGIIKKSLLFLGMIGGIIVILI